MSVDTLLIHFPQDLPKQTKLPPNLKREVVLSPSFAGKKQLNLILILPPAYLMVCLGRNSRGVWLQSASGKRQQHCLPIVNYIRGQASASHLPISIVVTKHQVKRQIPG
jgi:hypothetical protein